MPVRSSDRVSVILPTYNRAALLPRAIDSALAQTAAPHEIIVIDDGSTDETRVVLEGYGDRLVVMRQDNRGAAAARNLGLTRACGDWIAFLDSDDEWLPRKLELQLAAVRETGAALCFTGAEVGGPEGGSSGAGPRGVERVERALELVLDRDRPTYLPSLLVRRSLLEETGGFDETLRVAEDTKLVFALAAREPAAYLHEGLLRIDRSEQRAGLITDELDARKQRALGGIHVLRGALEAGAGGPAVAGELHRRLAHCLADLAGLHCLEGRFGEARARAREALRHRGDARTRVKSLAALVAPRLLGRLLVRRQRRP